MEHETPRLAEALTEEQSWEDDGITVLTATVTLPQLSGGDRRIRRFNRYYRRFCRAYFTYCRQIILPEAAASCRAALAVSAPWTAAHAALCWHPSCHTDEILSVVCDARETVHGLPPFQIRRSEVWDLNALLPMPLSEFFPARVRCKKALLRFARAETLRRVEQGAVMCESWRGDLRRALNPRNFYLTDEGLCFYYPLCAVASAKEGIVTFTMPYDNSSGPFSPDQFCISSM